VLVDANLLLYAVNRSAREHERAAAWLAEQLSGSVRVGLPWASLHAFLRIVTHPRAFERPLDAPAAWRHVRDWLDAPVAWIPEPGPRHAEILGRLLTDLDLRANLVPDAALAALALEHGVPLASNDSDFARFPGLDWRNPLG
jgi:toxin-antitoxin system PIN domain toxin